MVGIADDGAVLMAVLGTDGSATLYRLAPGATAWQSLGIMPPADGYFYVPTYEPTPGRGMLWALTDDPKSQRLLLASSYL